MLKKHGYKPTRSDEFLEYALESPIKYDDPLRWWKNEDRFPTLAAMARDHLAVQATSAASERAFSRAKRAIGDQRTRLNEETLRILMCLGSWLS